MPIALQQLNRCEVENLVRALNDNLFISPELLPAAMAACYEAVDFLQERIKQYIWSSGLQITEQPVSYQYVQPSRIICGKYTYVPQKAQQHTRENNSHRHLRAHQSKRAVK